MSEAKRQQLIEQGKLRPDGSRIERCPVCGHELTDEEAARINPSGSAVAQPDAVEAGVTAPEPN